MYPEITMQESIKRVALSREKNMQLSPRRMTAEEKDVLLRTYHPDYKAEQFRSLRFGPNKGERVPLELADLLEGTSLLMPSLNSLSLSKPDYDTDVLIIGGGGAGCAAAIEAHNSGAKVLIATKLRIGDANTMMAEGGIQAADKENDSPAQHFLDAYGGGHFAAQKDLLYLLVNEAPEAIRWLSELGVEFDKTADGTMVTTHGGGTSRKRMHAAKDYSGAEIMRTLRDEVLNRDIQVLDFTAAIELLTDENGCCAGAVLQNMETNELLVARAKAVILATGGAGRLHYQGFPTSNHYGATADGLVLAYRAGARLIYADTLQYHPTGAAYPAQIYGALVTEKVRSLGAMLVNANGEVFMNPLETRDVAAAAIIRECTERNNGIVIPNGIATSDSIATPDDIATSDSIATSDGIATPDGTATSDDIATSDGIATPDGTATSDDIATSDGIATSKSAAGIAEKAAVWLDTPMIEKKHGAGTIEKRIPAMLRMFKKHGIDIRTEPIPVYPTLHYQNGGLKISADTQTELENLYAAGEVVGGIHGRNRLMGNSLLDIIVFGRNAGKNAANKAKTGKIGALTLNHLKAFESERAKAQATGREAIPSPLLLPDYTRKV